MPPSLPLWGDKRDYDMDAPITVFGTTQARLVGACCSTLPTAATRIWRLPSFALPGEALLESNTAIDFVYCSPSLRCVQTAQNILRGE